MQHLDILATGRDNNFNLIRLLLAFAVLSGHGFNIYNSQTTDPNPFINTLYGLGFMSLDAFFVISGFMITASIERRRNIIEFIMARWLRVFPALIVVSLICALVVGPLVTTQSLDQYFSSPETWGYVVITGLTTHPDMTLPGVFADHSATGAVNRPIWTLRYELVLYCLTLGVFCLGLLNRKWVKWITALFLCAYFTKVAVMGLESGNAFMDHFSRFALAYIMGACACIYRDKIIISLFWFAPLAGMAMVLSQTPLHEITTILACSYLVFWCAYIPNGRIRNFNRAGDYSYGVYIIHWPVASTLLALWPDLVPLQLIALTVLITLPCAVASWHFVEKPALGLLKKVAAPKNAQRLKVAWIMLAWPLRGKANVSLSYHHQHPPIDDARGN